MNVNFTIDTTALTQNFSKLKSDVDSSIKSTLQKLIIELTNYIKTSKLSGSVLKVQTGRLRNSIHYRVNNSGSSFSAEAFTNVKYAAVHEYGFNGNVTVKAHMRNIKQAFGRPIAARSINIGSHTKRMNLPERSFMRSSLNEQKNKIYSEIENAIDRVI